MNSTHQPYDNAYEVRPNLESFHKFNETFSSILNTFEDELSILSCDMIDHFEKSKQPEEEFNRKMQWCYQLKNIISKHNPTWLFNIVPTGSSVTGLATKDSDLDVAIHIPQAAIIVEQNIPNQDISEEDRKVYWRDIQLEILQIVRLILENDEQIKSYINWDKGIQLVQAQIQILKIETVDEIECDISVVMEPFLSSMHNSFMIRHFVNIDSRFAPFCAIVKTWAARTGVKDPKDGGFNSYALVLLVIHFLQCGTYPPILPNLSKVYSDENFIAISDIEYPSRLDFGQPLPRMLPQIGVNRAIVAQLFLEFLHYYSKFDFQKKFISMKDASVTNRNESPNPNVRNENQKEVYIGDPFDAHNPGRTVRTIRKIQKIFRDTLNMFIPKDGGINDEQVPKNSFLFPSLHDILNMKTDNSSAQNQSDLETDEIEQEPIDEPCSSDFANL